ncbi:alpha/beta hydrolase [Shewanella aestuarii]|uniref:Alpha/beta hydrolase n=1 Tax=Shewanella aestuarii TaxID=1028752 RepID=A0A6G9QJY1_9GAMM|nr:alpha/beta hydrolase [Shewanella aestuarii]QIR14377.1 alpha/beta hydrolase [Shewanella aestuarii]
MSVNELEFEKVAEKAQTELILPLAHIRIAAMRYGDENKPIILACHGWLDNLNSFLPLAELFLASDLVNHYQLITFDWPGHGFSEHRPGTYPLHFIDYVYDLDAVVEYLTHDNNLPITLLGHSLGGLVAAAYNASFVNRIEKLILIEALSPINEPAEFTKTRLQDGIKQHRLFNAKKQQSPAFQDRGYANLDVIIKARQQLTGLDEIWCRMISQRNVQLVNQRFYWRSDPRLKLDSLYRMTFEQVDALMSQSDTSTLLVLGEQGFKQLKLMLEHTDKWFSRITISHLEGDHHVHMGNAGALLQQIRAFILK